MLPDKNQFITLVKRKALGLLALLVFGGAATAFGLSLLSMFLRPISGTYQIERLKDSYTLHIGDEAEAEYRFNEVTDRPLLLFLQKGKLSYLHFESSDENVATVDAKGHIIAVGEGRAEIRASVSDETAVFSVESFVPGSRLSFSMKEYSMNCGDELSLQTVVEPENAVLFEEITCTCPENDIILMDGDGKITALHPGSVEITCQADGLLGTATVQVYQPMTGISFEGIEDGALLTLERGETLQFSVAFYPEDTTDDRTLTYLMTDETVGTIDGNGLFTATGRGATVLAVRCGRFTDSVEIFSRVTLLGIETDHQNCAMKKGETERLAFVPVPEDTTDLLEVSYISENEKVISVSEDGTVKAVGGGTADVVLRVNGFEKRCTYTVTVPITGVSISRAQAGIYKGEGLPLQAAVVPSDTTEADRSIQWSSDNPEIATVDANGNVKAVATGQTVIRAKHGAFQAACVVKVTIRPDPNVVADKIIAYGSQFLGTPYVLGGGSLTGGIDCSTFTRLCFATQGIGLPLYSYTQVGAGAAVSLNPSAWRKGDLIFYSPMGRVSHVAIYIGDGKILHSSESQGGVCITPYNYGGLTPSHVRRYF